MRVNVIFNPSSDLGRARKSLSAIRESLRSRGPVDLVVTEKKGHARELACAAAQAGYDLVVAAGGDGTIHEVVNGLYDAQRPDVRLGVIPVGSGNDFAYALDLPLDVDTAVDRLFAGMPHPVDLALVEDERGRRDVFHNNFGVGFDAMVVIQTERIDYVHGFMMYLLAVFQTMAFHYERPLLTLRFDTEEVQQLSLFLTLGLGRRHGGGFLLTPDARQNDGLIDSCLVNSIGRATMLRTLTKAIKGTHTNEPFVSLRQNRVIDITSNLPLPIHIDGEVFATPEDNVRHVHITCLPGALQVMV